MVSGVVGEKGSMAKDWVWIQGHQREEGAAMGDGLGRRFCICNQLIGFQQ